MIDFATIITVLGLAALAIPILFVFVCIEWIANAVDEYFKRRYP